MRARPGDRIVLAAPHTSEATRDGEVLEARGPDGGPPYVVRWSDGHEGLLYPGPGALFTSAPMIVPRRPPPHRNRPSSRVLATSGTGTFGSASSSVATRRTPMSSCWQTLYST